MQLKLQQVGVAADLAPIEGTGHNCADDFAKEAEEIMRRFLDRNPRNP